MSGATLAFYRAGTSSEISIYQDSLATTPHTNPVVADSAGRFAPIFLVTPDAYKFILKTSGGVTVQTVDRIPIGGDLDTETLGQVVDELENAVGEFTGRALIHDEADTVGYDAGGRNIIDVDGLSMSATLQIGEGGAIKVGTGTAFADVSVLRTRTTMDWHAFEDWGTLNISGGAALGYASFDGRPTLNSSVEVDHFVPFQARPYITGAGDITGYVDGYNSLFNFNGSGTVENAHNFRVRYPANAGFQAVTNLYGLYVPDLASAAINHWGIFSADLFNRFAALQVTNNLTLDGLFTSSASTVGMDKPLTPKSYTVATLPAVASGIAFASDGRKSGEGGGAGTGVPVYFNATVWRTFYDNTTVQA